MKILRCREVGFDCDHEIRAQSEKEVLHEAARHAQQVHGVEVTPELAAQVQSLIHDQTEQDTTLTRNPRWS
jgi:predicted small metal-binding protein